MVKYFKKCMLLIMLMPSVITQVSAEVLIMTDNQNFIAASSGEIPADGTIQSVYALLFARIGVPANFVLMPLGRQNRMLEQTVYPACSLYRFKSDERAKKYAFSNMVYFLLHYKLYQQDSLPPLHANLLNGRGQLLSLTHLFKAQPDSTLLVIPKYSYGTELDKQLLTLSAKTKIEWTGSDPHNRLTKLFFAGRGHYALMFPEEVVNYLSEKTIKSDKTPAGYRRYSIENVDEVTKGYMMCNKHPSSYAFIRKVNAVLPSLYTSSDYERAHTDFYDDNEKSYIQEILKDISRSLP